MTMLTIIIKALNEEAKIARAIESCLEATKHIDAEVILADSGSTDRTLEIARRYPVIVTQVLNRDEGRCGAGPQLGYQISRGKYVYVLDGDMELHADFIAYALDFMETHPDVGGLGGDIVEMQTENLEFQNRQRRSERIMQRLGPLAYEPYEWTHLAGGALYRRAAIDQVGYLSDRNLRGSEEFDLAARLRLRRWRVLTCNRPAANHYSHELPTMALVWLRIRSGMILSVGQIVRAAIEGGFLRYVLAEVRIVRIALLVFGFWAASLLAAFVLSTVIPGWATLGASLLLLLGFMSLRSGSVQSAAFSVFSWHLAAIGLLVGVAVPRRNPRDKIAASVDYPSAAGRRTEAIGLTPSDSGTGHLALSPQD